MDIDPKTRNVTELLPPFNATEFKNQRGFILSEGFAKKGSKSSLEPHTHNAGSFLQRICQNICIICKAGLREALK